MFAGNRLAAQALAGMTKTASRFDAGLLALGRPAPYLLTFLHDRF